MRESLTTILLIVLFLYVYSSRGNRENTLDSVVINIGSKTFNTLDPHLASDLHSWFFIRHLGEGLLRYNPDNQLKPALAKSYTVSDDQLSVEFKLRDAQWNDGTPITANDFLETWKRGLRNKPLGSVIHEFMIVKNVGLIRSGDLSPDDLGVTVVDDRTLLVEFDYPIGDLLDVFASPSLYPLPEKQRLVYDCTVEGGAYRYEEETKSLVFNEKYWDKNVAIKSIKLTSIEEQQPMLEEFNKNNIDYCGKPFTDINPDVVNTYNKKVYVHSKQTFY